MSSADFLKELMGAFGPSGFEGDAAAAFRREMEKTADGVETDRAGNVAARYDGTDPKSPVIMAYAHMDSVGFIIRKIEKDGFIGCERLGGIPEKALPGLNIRIRAVDGRYIDGVIGSKSHHTVSEDEKYRVNKISEMYMDIGASSAAHARELGVEIGCPVIYRPFFQRLAGDFVSGTFIDDRGGLAALAGAGELLKAAPHASTVYLVGTVWEEFNLRGGALAARRLRPDIAISLDVAMAGDTRDLESRFDTACGQGPVLMHYTFHSRGTLNGTIPHMGLSNLAVKAAKDSGIPLQHFAGTGMLTDSAYIQLEGDGPAAVEIGFPVRYTHSPAEVASLSDIRRLGELLAAMIANIGPGFNLSRY